MSMLTPDQLSAIDHHLRKDNWLLNDDLITELTDHYVAGLENRLAQGTKFEVAIREIHVGFGGRKGLLNMEENFQKSQEINRIRITWNLLFTYFRLPRLGITFLIMTLVYSILRLLPAKLHSWNDGWLFIGSMAAVSILYILALIQLITEQTRKSKSVNQELRMLVQGVTSLFMIGIYIRVWLPVEEAIIRYPLPASVLITLFVIFEFATIELLFNQIYKNRTAKTA